MFADHERITTTVNSAVLVLLMTLLSIQLYIYFERLSVTSLYNVVANTFPFLF